MTGSVTAQRSGMQRMHVPLVDLSRQYGYLRDDLGKRFDEIFESMQLFLGPNVRGFEHEFAEYLGAREFVGVGDGTTALHLALRACGVEPGDEVITVSYTFFATIEAITLAGATPVLVDIDPGTYTMDVDCLEQAITSRTRAIIPVHLYGLIADMDGIMDVAQRHGLAVIEDACQAHGARREGRAAGTFGNAGCFSFYCSKNLGAYGEAGGVVTNDVAVARNLRLLRDHGSPVRYYHDVMGLNGRLDELQAAVLRVKLPYLDRWNEARRRLALYYNSVLTGLPIKTPRVPGRDHVFHLYVIETPHRDELREYLQLHGIHTGVHYPVPGHLQPACAPYSNGLGSLPVTESLMHHVLSLPLFPECRCDEIDYVAEIMTSFFAQIPHRNLPI